MKGGGFSFFFFFYFFLGGGGLRASETMSPLRVIRSKAMKNDKVRERGPKIRKMG